MKILFPVRDVLFPIPYIKNDYDILKKYFVVKLCILNLKNIILLPFLMYRSDIIFIWFAGFHTFIISLLNIVIKKPMIIVTGGFDVACEKEIKYGYMRLFFSRFTVKFNLKRASSICVVSEYNKKETEKYIKTNKIKLIYNSVDQDFFKPFGKKEEVILTVSPSHSWDRARLKGLDIFIKVARNLPEYTFFLIGPRLEAYECLEKIIPENVKLIGHMPQKELLKYYQEAKVYCQLSYVESCDVSLEEAMSCECVPIVTNSGAMPEVVKNSGYVVTYGNVDETTNSIKKALIDNKKGKVARKQIIKSFSLFLREERLKELCLEIFK